MGRLYASILAFLFFFLGRALGLYFGLFGPFLGRALGLNFGLFGLNFGQGSGPQFWAFWAFFSARAPGVSPLAGGFIYSHIFGDSGDTIRDYISTSGNMYLYYFIELNLLTPITLLLNSPMYPMF